MNFRSCILHSHSICALIGVAALAQHALAAPIVIQPTAAVATSEYATRLDTYAVNGTGLSALPLVTTGSPIPVVWPTHGTTPDGFMWLTNNTTPGVIVFDLGALYSDLAGFHVWNYNESSGWMLRGMRNVTVEFSTVSAAGPFTDPIVYTGATQFAQASGTTTEVGESKLFPRITAQWIRFTGDRWGGNGNPAELYTGLSEVRFFTTDPPVPEPSTFALLGLGAIGLAIKSRRRRAAA